MGFRSFFRIDKGVVLRPESSTPTDSNPTGALFYSSTGDVFRGHSGGQYRDLLTADQEQDVTNKTIDPSLNDIPLANAQILVGNASGVAAAVAVTGDVTINSSGDIQIVAGAIVNADINATAAVDRSKLASGSVNHVVINNASGVLSSEAQLAKSRGGLGADASLWTFPSSGDTRTFATLEATETFTGSKTFDPGVDFLNSIRVFKYITLVGADDGTGGTNVTIPFGSNQVAFRKLNSSGLESIAGIAFGEEGRSVILTNNTGNPVIIRNDESSASPETRILTGTGADIILEVDATIQLIYDGDSGINRWRVIGGVGGGSVVGTPDYNAYFDGGGFIASEQYVSKSRGGAGDDMTNVTFPTTGTILTDLSSIPRAQVAVDSANYVVINDVSGNLSSEQFLSKSRGGAGADITAVTFPATGTLATTSQLGFTVSAQTSLLNNGTITLGTQKFQAIIVGATGLPVVLDSTPFGLTPPENGTVVRLIGAQSGFSVTIRNNNIPKSCILNGDVTLGPADSIDLMYTNSGGYDNYIEIARSST